MESSFAPIVQLYALSGDLYLKALDGLTREQLLARCGDHTNPILWMAGHLATVRCGVSTMIGVPRERPWGKMFDRGATLGEAAAFPDVEDIRRVWASLTADLARRFAEMTEADLLAPAPRPFPIPDRTLRGAVTFLAFHEAYHVGQISFVRKSLGFPGLIDS